jgi:Spx/MgsR family transcriptional regulator
MYTLYGIKNCDTVKKARKWLDDNTIAYQFHDFRSDGLDNKLLTDLEAKLGWENMLNRRSTSWRQLDDKRKDDLSLAKAIILMLETPTLIKRPVLDTGEQILIGFKLDDYQKLR